MSRLHQIIALFGLAAVGLFSLGGERQPIPELKPREVMFSAERLSLQEALDQLGKQTGNVVKDGRKNPSNPLLTLPKKSATFWQALDTIGKQTGVGFSAYQEDGGVALVDAPYRELTTHHSGLFRFALKRIAVSRDDETQAHLCHVTLDAAWEPRLRLLYLNVEQAAVTYGQKRAVQLERQSARPVAGASATEFELRMNAPDRATRKIDLLEGKIRVVGAPKMLEFQFANLAGAKEQEKEGVKVRVRAVKKGTKQWRVELEDEYPRDAFAELQSFEKGAVMDNNRVWLTWHDAQAKKTLELDKILDGPGEGSGIVYTFEPKGPTPLPAKDAEVTLHYLTPNRVVAFTAPFKFQELPLP
jgi:hypothetical protein